MNKKIIIINEKINKGLSNMLKNTIGKIQYKKDFKVSALLEEAYDNCEYVGETIEKKAKDISKIISNDNSEVAKYITYIIREIGRNVVEHSKSEYCYISCTKYFTENIIHICVEDGGIGIKESLNQNRHFHFEKDSEAIAMSVQPGITKAYKRVKRNPHDIWQNSGFGLYMVSSICQEKGEFSIVSGNTQLKIKGNNVSLEKLHFSGTKVDIVLNIGDELGILSKRLSILSKIGNKYARSWDVNTIKTASHSSTILSDNFSND